MPLCLLPLPGAPKNFVKGEFGSKSAWQDAESRAAAPPTVRAQYERISEWLITMGAEEVFPDAVALLRWRDRNQRMLPKLALDGVATRESTEQLVHCLQSGDKDSQVVVYGHGVAQPIEISPPLLAAWSGTLLGFSLARWVHQLSANSKKLMAVMENVTKLVRANKFKLDTVLYKVGEDAIADAFARSADASDSAQVVLIFPTLQEEVQHGGEERAAARREPAAAAAAAAPAESKSFQPPERTQEDEERERLKAEWLNLLFTEQSVAAVSPEGPLPVTLEAGNITNPSSLVVWVGDDPASENQYLKSLYSSLGSSALMVLSWSEHPAGEGLGELSLTTPEVVDGSWFLRDRQSFENEDLDQLHDVELLGRSMVEAISQQLQKTGLEWKNVILAGFGKGAGVAFYSALIRLIPHPVAGGIFFNPVIPFPAFLAEKGQNFKRPAGSAMKMFTIWGSRDKATPAPYKQLLVQVIRKFPEVHATPDTLPEADHSFGEKSMTVLTSLLPLVMPR